MAPLRDELGLVPCEAAEIDLLSRANRLTMLMFSPLARACHGGMPNLACNFNQTIRCLTMYSGIKIHLN
jgi:hypothetical protein